MISGPGDKVLDEALEEDENGMFSCLPIALGRVGAAFSKGTSFDN